MTPITLTRLLEYARANPDRVFDMSDGKKCLGACMTGATYTTTSRALYGGTEQEGPGGVPEVVGAVVVDHNDATKNWLMTLWHCGVKEKTGAELALWLGDLVDSA